MIEALLSSGQKEGASYPNSGPGIKTLAFGDETLGYFGEVSQEELVSVFDLRQQLSFWEGEESTGAIAWIKMFLDGTVIYFPKYPTVYNVGWNALYNAGLVYGTDDNGLYPSGSPTNQFRVVSKSGHLLKVRCFKGRAADPTDQNSATAIGSGAGVADWATSDWARIIYSLTDSAKPTSYTGPVWNLYQIATSLIVSSYSAAAQNTRQALLTQCMTISNTSITVAPKSDTTNLRWFPVLELITNPGYLVHGPVDGVVQEDGIPLLLGDPVNGAGYHPHRESSGSAVAPLAELIQTHVLEDAFYHVEPTSVNLQINAGLAITVTSVEYT